MSDVVVFVELTLTFFTESIHHNQRLGRCLGVHHHRQDIVHTVRIAGLARLQALCGEDLRNKENEEV